MGIFGLQLKEKLVRYGVENFEEVTLVEDTKNEGMNRGFAFLDFSSRAAAVDACKRLQKRDVVFGTDRTARVSFADTFIEPDDEIMSQVCSCFMFLSSTCTVPFSKTNTGLYIGKQPVVMVYIFALCLKVKKDRCFVCICTLKSLCLKI